MYIYIYKCILLLLACIYIVINTKFRINTWDVPCCLLEFSKFLIISVISITGYIVHWCTSVSTWYLVWGQGAVLLAVSVKCTYNDTEWKKCYSRQNDIGVTSN